MGQIKKQKRSFAKGIMSGLMTLCSHVGVVLGIDEEVESADMIAIGEFAKIMGAAFADAGGTLYIDYYATEDATRVIHTETFVVTADTADGGFIADVITPFMKARYVNGGAAQTDIFELHVFGRKVS